MLPSRGIVRSLSSANAQKQFVSQRISTRTFGNGRQLSTVRRTLGNGLRSSTAASVTTRYSTAPIALGGVASARTFSLWGYGTKATPSPDAAASAATATPPAENVVPDQTLESAAAATANSSSSAAQTVSDAAQSLAEATPSADLSAISDIVNNTAAEILSRPEGLGYLKSLGLEYGWGFTSIMQWTIEHVHVWTGFGWGGAIVTTAVLMRLVMFYPQIKSTAFAANMKKLQDDPRQKDVMEKFQKGLRDGDQQMVQQTRLLGNVLREEYNVPLKGMVWGFIPIPFSFGMFRIISGMASLPVPSLETAGWFWFRDLTLSDPYFILPALTTGVMVLTLNMNAKHSTVQQQKMMNKMKWVLAPIMLIGTSFLSAGVNIMGLTLAASTMATQVLLNVPSVRTLFGIPPIVPPPAPAPEPAKPVGSGAAGLTYEAPRQPLTMREKLEENLGEMKQGFQESITKMTGRAAGSAEEQAAKTRRDAIRKLEETRAKQEREHFEQKYKNKK